MMKGKPLSPRELEVLHLLWEGYTQREISKKLHRSFNTISMHRQNILTKFGVTSTTAALKIAVDQGLISPPVTRIERAS